MMKNLIYSVFFISLFFISSCGKTDADKENEKKIIGKWSTPGNNPVYNCDSVVFVFTSDNSGSSIRYMHGSVSESNSFTWEIKRNFVDTYYKKGPSNYWIGYDQYNSKGMYKINSIETSKMELVQSNYDGTEIVIQFHKIK